ncbi:YbaB/EbfC family nucleoid-associated protein [Streptomyces sp. NPDC048594]|uniref:YbaB/EbfC family nucleoid-associated protein n=1 Tax=Streptomyces sp. NPDC048594 TaxID=3365575 RepID=UPI00371F5897
MNLDGGPGLQRLLDNTRRLQQDLARAQEEFSAVTVQGTAGGGAVKATVDSNGVLTDLRITPAVAAPDNSQGLADLVLTAVQEAQRALAVRHEERFVPLLKSLDSQLGNFPG